jgi:hypothetical protein
MAKWEAKLCIVLQVSVEDLSPISITSGLSLLIVLLFRSNILRSINLNVIIIFRHDDTRAHLIIIVMRKKGMELIV